MIVVFDVPDSCPTAACPGPDGGDRRLSTEDRAELLNAMAEIYSTSSTAAVVLDRLGVPRSRRRSWEGQTALDWWSYAFADFDHGIVSDPYPRILGILAADYPTNAVARRLGSKYGPATGRAEPAAPQQGGSVRPTESSSPPRLRSAADGPGHLDPSGTPPRSTTRRRAGRLGRLAGAATVLLLPLPLAIADTTDTTEPPLAAYLASCSMLFMAAFLPPVLLVYLCRSRTDRLSRELHPVPAKRYLARLGYPVGGVIVLSLIGYYVVGTHSSNSANRAGSFLGLVLVVVGVFRLGVISLRVLEQDEKWPPTDLPADEPVPIRRALRRVRDSLTVPALDNSTALGVLDILCDQALPAVRARRDRPFRNWLREERRVKYVVGWCLLTVGLVNAAVLPTILGGRLAGILTTVAATAVIAVWWGVIGWISYLHARWDASQLADQISQETEDLRARIAVDSNASSSRVEVRGGNRA